MTIPTATMTAVPTGQQERITILDSLRGIAILGILLMNIPGFGLPEVQTSDPSVLNETGINYKTWYTVDWALAGTQRAIFSMLFGAGMILFITRLEKRIDGMQAAIYFFRRQMWLLAFGLFNAFVLLWFWDILYAYAIFGMLLFVFYRKSPKVLYILAFVCLVLMTVRENVDLYRGKKTIRKGELVTRIDTTQSKLTIRQKEDLEAMNGMKEESSKESKLKKHEKELRAIGGNYASLYKAQSDKSAHVELYYTYYLAWDVLLFMFLGMAFFKTGVLTGNASNKLYWLMFIGGLGLGLLLSYFNQKAVIDTHFSQYEYTKKVPFNFYQVQRMLRSLGFFGLIMLMYKSGWFKWLFGLFRPVGQMAFTNYLAQSLIGGLFFYGIGLNYFGKLERYELYIYMVAVWIIEIIWSHIWLRYNRFGPLEWLWRSLTYWKKQPLKKNKSNTDTMGMQ
ncbi:MAG TPA: DUF418 domain-containing protein [Chitinophagaceae bacterium]|nr:DUF418 domain-containing protein [Chitinophagaceae bacterium]